MSKIQTTKISRSRVIAASADDVWRLVRDFSRAHLWMPGLPAPIEVSGDPEVAGALRVFDVGGGVKVVERLVSLDEPTRTIRYSIVEAPIQFHSHVGSISVSPQGNEAQVTWEAIFEVDAALSDTIATVMGDSTFEPGLESLAKQVEVGGS